MRVCQRAVPSLIATLFIAFLPKLLSSQVVYSGTRDPHYCTKAEKIEPNLNVAMLARITGSLVDDSEEPLKYSFMTLRRYVSAKQQDPVETVQTDALGRFDLGDISPGKYRLLAPATRDFRQPEQLTCTTDKCTFDLKLKMNSTDMPLSVCPIR